MSTGKRKRVDGTSTDGSNSIEDLGVGTNPEAVDIPEAVRNRIIASCSERVATGSMAGRVKQLEAAATEVGVRRKAFLEAIALLGEHDPAVTICYDKTSVSVNKFGAALFHKESHGQDLARFAAGVHPSARSALPGSAPGNKQIGRMLIPAGVCAIVAGGGKGKTPLSHSLASAGVSTYSVVRVGEPLAGYASSHEAIAYSLAIAILDSADVVFDSIKDLLSGGGAAMKSGLSREALTSLSGWASTACDAGCTIYIPVNPSTPDPEVVGLLVEAGKSNATMLVTPIQGANWEYFNRKGEGLPRSSGKFELSFAADGLATIKNGSHNSESAVSEEEITKVVSTALSRATISNAARRALSLANKE